MSKTVRRSIWIWMGWYFTKGSSIRWLLGLVTRHVRLFRMSRRMSITFTSNPGSDVGEACHYTMAKLGHALTVAELAGWLMRLIAMETARSIVRCSLRPFILLHLMIYEVEIYSPVGTSVTFSVWWVFNNQHVRELEVDVTNIVAMLDWPKPT